MVNRMFASETLDSLLDELTDLALTSPQSATFFQSLLDSAIQATGAEAGAIWRVVGLNYRLEQEVGLVRLGIGSSSQLQAIHEEALEYATKGPSSNGPSSNGLIGLNTNSRASDGAADSKSAATELVSRTFDGKSYLFYGCRDREQAYLVIELVHAGDPTNEADRGSLGAFMAALSEIARDFRNAQTLTRLQLNDNLWGDFKSILLRLHSSIQLSESAYHIANEGRRFLCCDRLSVAIYDGQRASLVAVSGVSSIEKRAKQVRELESLVTMSAKSGMAIRYPTDEVESPQLSEGLHRYLDVSQCERIGIYLMRDTSATNEDKLSADRRCFGALIVEFFEVQEVQELEQRAALLVQHASVSLKNSLDYDRLPLRRLSERLQQGKAFARKYRLGIVSSVGALLTLLCLAVVIPSDLNITAQGTIQPMAMQHLYAPASGEVVRVHAAHQSEVQKGALLLELRSRELELRKEELLTLFATTQEKLRSIEVARLQNRKSTQNELITAGDLSASESELREVMSSQQEQLAILNAMLDSLQLTSPVTGQVISWDPGETLDHRPVQQGQKLLSVAEIDGAGRLQLRVLDEDARHIITAYQSATSPVRVTFSIASEPGVRHSAIVYKIGTTVETVSADGATLRIDAQVDASEMANVRPGATVNAKIHCGKASLGYVWTRRLWDFISFYFI